MKFINIPIAFFGTPRFAQIVLEKLINSPFKPTLVVTTPNAKSGRGQKFVPTPVKQTAEKSHIEVLTPKNLSNPKFIRQLSAANCQLCILVAYGKIIPKKLLSIPKFGFINVHPSLLPKYRGPSPIQSAVLNGEGKTGVTIMLLDEELDHGPTLSQLEIEIGKNDTNKSLHENLGQIGADLLIKTLPQYLEEKIKPKPQDHSKATFTKQITRNDGRIELNNPPSKEKLDRIIRAFYPWPGVWTKVEWKVKSGKWKVLKIKLIPETKYKIQNTFLIQPEGKRPMTIKEFLNGYPQTRIMIEKLFKQ